MKFKTREEESNDINLTPLIDVVFLLLIFFMVTTTFDKNAAIKIELPTADSKALKKPSKGIDLIIDGQGRYFINGREVLNSRPETLFKAMTQVLNQMEGTPPLVISADANANYQAVVSAMDIAGRLGLSNFSLATTQTARQ